MKERSKRGLAAMSPERRREIARRGGLAAHRSGRAHKFTSAEARAAGLKGGRSIGRNVEHMRAIGRLGGRASAKARCNTEEAGDV
jgi:general stress protein YciG